MSMSEYSEIFKTESDEHLQQLNQNLLELEQDFSNIDNINVMFRAAHTLKGMSATMGYTRIADLTHEMENLMDRIRGRELELNREIIDLLFQCLDCLEMLIENVDNDETIDTSDLISRIKSAASGAVNVDLIQDEGLEDDSIAIDEIDIHDLELSDDDHKRINKLNNEGHGVIIATICLDNSCLLKAARSALVLRSISNIGEVIKTIPSVEELEDEKFDTDFKVIFATSENKDRISENVTKISEVKKVTLF